MRGDVDDLAGAVEGAGADAFAVVVVALRAVARTGVGALLAEGDDEEVGPEAIARLIAAIAAAALAEAGLTFSAGFDEGPEPARVLSTHVWAVGNRC